MYCEAEKELMVACRQTKGVGCIDIVGVALERESYRTGIVRITEERVVPPHLRPNE